MIGVVKFIGWKREALEIVNESAVGGGKSCASGLSPAPFARHRQFIAIANTWKGIHDLSRFSWALVTQTRTAAALIERKPTSYQP